MSSWKSRIIIYTIATIGVLLNIYFYPRLPDMIPSTWSIGGNVEYSNKIIVFMFAAMFAVFAIMFDIIPKIDPRRKNYSKFKGYYSGFCIFIMIFILIFNLIVISESFVPGRINVSRTVIILIGVMFIFIGNMLPKIKNNFYFGIKTPWTLSNSDVWNKTHRLGGILMFISGICTIILGFLLSEIAMFIAFMALIIISTTIPMIMSFIWYRRIEKEEQH